MAVYQIRISVEERAACAKFAELRGFVSMSSWLRELMERDMAAHPTLAKKARSVKTEA